MKNNPMFRRPTFKAFTGAFAALLVGVSQSVLADVIDWQGSKQQGGLLLGKISSGYSVSYAVSYTHLTLPTIYSV